MNVKTIDVSDLKKCKESESNLLLIDVREPEEFEEVSSPWAQNFPLSSLNVKSITESLKLTDDPETPVYFICRSGMRSARAADQFQEAGFKNVYNVAGGMNSLEANGLPIRGGSRKGPTDR